ncbi:MAG: DUF6529 family protein [Ilumatobacter sp.]|uniref:DUF6529 family protein n=1 Tax=Ilumatobacter sp. TaxID=1967498 RepID=UPI00263279E4|nr:DUF6529 family protein [Ilumatobacter sp.]MDJ0768122.1 DUF6529 family protein [Ilumatobacter sp.]
MTATITPNDQQVGRTRVTPLVLAAGAGGFVALAIGTYGRVHTPTGQGMATFGFPAVLPMKAWFTTGAFALVLVQLATALRMWGRLPFPGTMPTWFPAASLDARRLHRWSGTAAFLLTLPVAYHCLWALGFQDTTPRVLVHSILGCAFYGAFTTKMLVLRVDRLPSWTLPVVGGCLVAILTGLWLTSSLWFFTNVGFPGV